MRGTALQLRNTIAKNSNKVRNVLIGLYILIILGFSASARAERMDLQQDRVFASRQSVQVQMTGEVALDTNGRAFLIVSDTEFYLLTSERGEDFSDFNGSFVSVEGVVFNYKSGPVLTTQFASSPLVESVVKKAAGPTLVVFEIYELPSTAIR